MEIYLFDYNVREGLSETQAVAWVPFVHPFEQRGPFGQL